MGLIQISLAILSLNHMLWASPINYDDEDGESLYGPKDRYEDAHKLLDNILKGEPKDHRRKRHFVDSSYEKRRVKKRKTSDDESGDIASPKHPHRMIKLTKDKLESMRNKHKLMPRSRRSKGDDSEDEMFTETLKKILKQRNDIDDNDIKQIFQDRSYVGEESGVDLRRLFNRGGHRNTFIFDLEYKNLPEAEPLNPGDTLIRPNKKMLKSASHYPKDDPHLVYGNFDNLGIRYGNKPFRNKYSSFRKAVLSENDLRRYLAYYARRNNISVEPDYVPPVKPGDSLIRPNKKMLKSASHYPKDDPHLVYGNAKNLGIRYGNKPFRNQYSSFRKTDERREVDDEDMISLGSPNHGRVVYPRDPKSENRRKGVKLLKLSEAKEQIRSFTPRPGLMAIAVDADGLAKFIKNRRSYGNLLSDIVDDDLVQREKVNINEPLHQEYLNFVQGRRQDAIADPLEDPCQIVVSSESEEERSAEKNPGNPYTIFKNKYKQNWLWNHEMTGDHMNINPYGPSFNTLGPTGAELFFGRKWWYYNQDDYIPFRRR